MGEEGHGSDGVVPCIHFAPLVLTPRFFSTPLPTFPSSLSQVWVGPQNSNLTGARVFRYEAPKVLSISPIVPASSGSLITVTGNNFGTDYNYKDIRVYVGGKECAILDQTKYYLLSSRTYFLDAVTGNFDYTVLPVATIVAAAPDNTGMNLTVQVSLGGQLSDPSDGIKFSYSQPYVTTMLKVVDTFGGNITIGGLNFGPVGTPATVCAGGALSGGLCVGGVLCTNGFVSNAYTQIICNMPGGVGMNKSVIVATGPGVGYQIASLGLAAEGQFSYNPPVIHSVSPTTATSGDSITIEGNNFGYDTSQISVDFVAPNSLGVWGVAQSTIAFNILHSKFQFSVPVGYSHDLDIVVTVARQTCITTTKGMRFTYVAPAITSSSSAPPSGGPITITGRYFGPVGFPSVEFAYAIDWSGAQIPCTNPRVTIFNTQLTCTMGPGLGQNLGLVVSVGNISSAVYFVYSYKQPVIRNVFPVSALVGDWVNVTGDNFGSRSDLVQVTVGGLFRTTAVIVTQSPPLFAADPTGLSNLTFRMPTGAGTNLAVTIRVPYGANVTSTSTRETLTGNSAQAGKSLTISFASPIIYSATSVATSGGITSVTGINLGPQGNAYINTVLVANSACSSPNVTVADTLIQCRVAPGSGTGKPVLAYLGAQMSIGGDTVFSYSPPTATLVTPAIASPGDMVRISGTSFGSDVGKLQVYLGAAPCTSMSYATPHFAIMCRVPVASGRNVTVQVTVDGNKGAVVSGLFGYSVAGCLNPIADDYNPEATSSSNCTITGCTRPTAYNFRAAANTDDGTCVNPPTRVTLTTSLDFSTYTRNASYFNDLIASTVAANLGITKTRVVNVTAVMGSTVFTFFITDDPNPSLSASAMATKLQSQVVNNESVLPASLGTLLSVSVSEPGFVEIRTAPPTVSTPPPPSPPSPPSPPAPPPPPAASAGDQSAMLALKASWCAISGEILALDKTPMLLSLWMSACP